MKKFVSLLLMIILTSAMVLSVSASEINPPNDGKLDYTNIYLWASILCITVLVIAGVVFCVKEMRKDKKSERGCSTKRIYKILIAVFLAIAVCVGVVFASLAIPVITGKRILADLTHNFSDIVEQHCQEKIVETKSVYGKLNWNSSGIDYFGAVLVKKDAVQDMDALIAELDPKFDVVMVMEQKGQKVESLLLQYQSLTYDTPVTDGQYITIYFYNPYRLDSNSPDSDDRKLDYTNIYLWASILCITVLVIAGVVFCVKEMRKDKKSERGCSTKRIYKILIAIFLAIAVCIGVVFASLAIPVITNKRILADLTHDFSDIVAQHCQEEIVETKSVYGELNWNSSGIDYFGAVLVKKDAVQDMDALIAELDPKFEVVMVMEQKGQKVESRWLQYRSLTYDTPVTDGQYITIYFYNPYRPDSNKLDPPVTKETNPPE